eukprot:6179678-Pleurochrysis_carterae.AAC.3
MAHNRLRSVQSLVQRRPMSCFVQPLRVRCVPQGRAPPAGLREQALRSTILVAHALQIGWHARAWGSEAGRKRYTSERAAVSKSESQREGESVHTPETECRIQPRIEESEAMRADHDMERGGEGQKEGEWEHSYARNRGKQMEARGWGGEREQRSQCGKAKLKRRSRLGCGNFECAAAAQVLKRIGARHSSRRLAALRKALLDEIGQQYNITCAEMPSGALFRLISHAAI